MIELYVYNWCINRIVRVDCDEGPSSGSLFSGGEEDGEIEKGSSVKNSTTNESRVDGVIWCCCSGSMLCKCCFVNKYPTNIH